MKCNDPSHLHDKRTKKDKNFNINYNHLRKNQNNSAISQLKLMLM